MTAEVETIVTGARQVPPVWQRATVGFGALAAVLGAAWGSGAFGGTPIAEAADGALAADATLLAPATQAFAIWSAIYTGLVLLAVLQAVPRTGASPRLRGAIWQVLAAMVLNAVWIAVVQAGLLLVSVGVLVAIVIALGWAVARMARSRPDSWLEAVALDVPVGLYLGWASVATVANITALGVVELGVEPDHGTWAAVGALGAVLLVAVAIVRDLRPQPVLPWSVALAMVWGVTWIGLGRLEDSPADPVVGWAAIGVAVAIACAAWVADLTVAWARWQRRRGRPY